MTVPLGIELSIELRAGGRDQRDDYDIRDTEHLHWYAERAGMSYRLRIQRKDIAGWIRVVR